MAVQVMIAGMGENQKNTMHPFFKKADKPVQLTALTPKATSPLLPPPPPPSRSGEEPSENLLSEIKPIVRKSSKDIKANIKAKRSATSSTPLVSNPPDAALSLEIDPNAGRRKRQKRDSSTEKENKEQALPDASSKSSKRANSNDLKDESSAWIAELKAAADNAEDDSNAGKSSTQEQEQRQKPIQDEAGTMIETDAEGPHLSEPGKVLSAIPIQTESSGAMHKDTQAPSTIPAVKLLRFNPKTGTIGSPPKKLAKADTAPKGKGLDTKRSTKKKSLSVIIKYSQNPNSKTTMGEKIDRILKGLPLVEPAEVYQTIQTKAVEIPIVSELPPAAVPKPVKLLKPSKPTHPFFLGNPRKNSISEKDLAADSLKDALPPLPQNEKTTTILRVSPTKKPRPESNFVGFGNSQAEIMTKFPGSMLPAWPWQGIVHVRGNTEANSVPSATHPAPNSEKKSKCLAIQILAHEDVLLRLGAKLAAKDLETTHPDNYVKPSRVLRIPSQDFKSGYEIQRHIGSEISTKLPEIENTVNSSSEDELQGPGQPQKFKVTTHPAIISLYKAIATSLSAFDKCECETQPWNQKYAPCSAEEVLQSGREAVILRNWLETSTVKLVDTGLSVGKSTSSEKGPSKKKKKTGKAMSSFIVSTDDEADDMAEISDTDQELHFNGVRGTVLKTVVKSGNASGKKGPHKLTNAVVMSGPNGSGKTAAVYAVAKELGFEIFEINPGSRRSGKDILEKVGDMTRNHLVQRPMGDSKVLVDEEAQSISDALNRDLESGRQGTMNTFFKPASTEPKSKTANVKTASTSTEPTKQIPKKQKQSLILIEEADILYDEDKQFWPTVLTLIAQSKRPVIITCNDESVIPLQTLSLHAIIRFTQTPLDLAADYMLLVAANEGHILKREAVKALYESRNYDLRGSLTELQFWCQFAVGDPKHGLNWRYDHWPLGLDKKNCGNVLRTVSKGTYDTGMGWLARDFLEEDQALLDIEEEMLRQAWDGWHLDAGNWQETLKITKWAERIQAGLKSKADRQEALNIYENFADTMSTADICAGNRFASGHKILLDQTVPELPEKALNDFTLGYELLHANDLVLHHSSNLEMSFWLKSRARETMQSNQLQLGWGIYPEMNSPSEAQTIEKIRQLKINRNDSLNRRDLSIAFDPIAEPAEKQSLSFLEPSVFDRTTALIILDIAPFVRSIVSYDARLQQERLRQSNLGSLGGNPGKRKLRTTRASNAALSGGARKTTRPDRYFGNALNSNLVLLTGRPSWQDAVTSSKKPIVGLVRDHGVEN